MKQFSRVIAFALLIPALTMSACDEDEEDDPADEVASVRLTVGTQTVTINSAGQATGTITIPRNTATTVTAVFLRADNSTVALPTAFRLDLTPQASSGLTFGRTGNFAGTLTGTTAGTIPVTVEIFHTGENHVDWGGTNHRFNVTVQ